MNYDELDLLPLVDKKRLLQGSEEVESSVPIAFTIDGEYETAVGILPDFKLRFNEAVTTNNQDLLRDLKDGFPGQYHAALLLFADKYSKDLSSKLRINDDNRLEKRKEAAVYFRSVISWLPGAREYYGKIMQFNLNDLLPNVSSFYQAHEGGFWTSVANQEGGSIPSDQDDFINLPEEDFKKIYDELSENIDLIDRMGYWKGTLVGILAEDDKFKTGADGAKIGASTRLPKEIDPIAKEYFRKMVLNKARIVAFINAANIKRS